MSGKAAPAPEAAAWKKEEKEMEEKIEALLAQKAKAIAEYDAQLDEVTTQLRETRYKLVDAGVYKSWYQSVLKES